MDGTLLKKNEKTKNGILEKNGGYIDIVDEYNKDSSSFHFAFWYVVFLLCMLKSLDSGRKNDVLKLHWLSFPFSITN